MDIVVLCGGYSPERNVSLSGGTVITDALRSKGHRVVPVDMYIGLEDYPRELSEIFDSPPLLNMARVGEREPDLTELKKSRRLKSGSLFGDRTLEVCAMADIVFIAMHGICGEDGRVQAALELLGIPFTGSGFYASALALDKDMTKRIVREAGIPTPDWFTVSAKDADAEAALNTASAKSLFPCVIKPLDSGSSIGVSIVDGAAEFTEAFALAASQGSDIIIERYIKGREIQTGVLGGEALPSIEIICENGFYDYINKYQPGAAMEICPAEIPQAAEKFLGGVSVRVHRLLGLSGYSRSDYIMDESGKCWFLEANTLPGMTPTSLFPQEAAAVGLDYAALCERIIALALEERGRRI